MEPLKLMRRLELSPSPRALPGSGERRMSCMYRYPLTSLAFPTLRPWKVPKVMRPGLPPYPPGLAGSREEGSRCCYKEHLQEVVPGKGSCDEAGEGRMEAAMP